MAGINIFRTMRGLLMAWSLTGLILIVATSLYYLQFPGFAEQGEVTFSAVSWLVSQGHPLYIDAYSAGRYSLQHGPAFFLVAGSVMKLLGPSYFTAKLTSVTAFLLGLAVSWLYFSKHLDKAQALFLVGLESWLLLHWPYSYLVRPDAMMFLCSAAGIYLATTARKGPGLIAGMALVFGLMLNLKIHGAFYFIPILTLIYQRLGGRPVILISGLAALIGVLPFLLPQISPANYFLWLTESIGHGFWWRSAAAKVVAIIILVLFPVALGLLRGLNLQAFYRRQRLFILSLAFSVILPAIIGSKVGSGTNHLLPFIPQYLYVVLHVLRESPKAGAPGMISTKSPARLACSLLAMILLIITAAGINGEKRMVRYSAIGDRTAIIADLKTVETFYAGEKIAVGFGDGSSDEYRDAVVYPVFHGHPYLVDPVAMGDMNGSGLAVTEATLAVLKTGAIDIWLIPAGQKPFAAKIFTGPFRETFLREYRPAGKTAFFDIWVHTNHN